MASAARGAAGGGGERSRSLRLSNAAGGGKALCGAERSGGDLVFCIVSILLAGAGAACRQVRRYLPLATGLLLAGPSKTGAALGPLFPVPIPDEGLLSRCESGHPWGRWRGRGGCSVSSCQP